MDENTVLTSAIKEEKNPKVLKRLIAVNMIKSNETSISGMVDRIGVSVRTIELWMERYEKHGVRGLDNMNIPGRPPRLSIKKIRMTASILLKINQLTPKSLGVLLHERHGILYSLCHIRRIMRKLDFSPKVATPTFANRANRRIIRAWRRHLRKTISRLKRMGYTVIIQDEAIFINGFHKGRKLWSRVGKRIPIMQTEGHKRIVVYGALAEDGSQLFRTYERFNVETFLKYLEEMRIKWDKIMVLLDNASQHTSRVVREYLKKHKSVILHPLPVASSELSAVEECWRQAKYEILVAKYYQLFTDMKDVVSEYFRVKRFYLNIYRYLERII